jgi:hypothetical protein
MWQGETGGKRRFHGRGQLQQLAWKGGTLLGQPAERRTSLMRPLTADPRMFGALCASFDATIVGDVADDHRAVPGHHRVAIDKVNSHGAMHGLLGRNSLKSVHLQPLIALVRSLAILKSPV